MHTLPEGSQQDAYRGIWAGCSNSGAEVFELLVERRDGFFEHSPMCGRTRAAEVAAGASPRQLQGPSPLFPGLLLGGHRWTNVDLSSGRLFLLGFH
jgi:hypothetical protein